MSDVVPKEGYTTLQEARMRLAVGLADRHVFLNKNQRLLAYDFAGLFSEVKLEVELQKSVNPSGDPDAEKLRKATLAWAKQELAVWKLYEALQNDALVSFVRDPAAGEMFRITAADWRGAAFWRDTIIGGEVRALPGELIERYNNRLVFIETPALEAWLTKAKEPTTVAAATDCLSWLEAEMCANPTASPHPKAHYLGEAKTRYAVSERQFSRLWDQAKQETGAKWKSGRRPKSPQ